ncbi:hypothetical protein ACIBH1_20065 [Nonomuraea sp. NPDC050663]|uniref:hypothetical protein n=1 Tax=Nonomuraea sp. NPDC050663 TaxID=3364370 RepID=UPI0037A0DF1A
MTTTPGRIVAGVVAMAATLPYLTLKLLWLTGTYVGVSKPDLFATSEMVGANAATFALDAVGLVLALAFTARWGQRLPAWLVALPLWVGTGLLSTIVLGVPATVLVEGLAPFSGDEVIASWVFMVVYGGFTVQGVALAAAFAFYAADRWPAAWSGRYGTAPPLQRVVAWGALIVCVVVGVAKLAMAERLPELVAGILALGGGAGYLALVLGRRHRAFLVAAWLGSGSMFGWALYTLIIMMVQGVPTTAHVVELFALMTGLVLGVAGAFLLTSGGGVVQAAQDPLEGDDREGDRRPAYQGHH